MTIRRKYSAEFKREAVLQTQHPGVSNEFTAKEEMSMVNRIDYGGGLKALTTAELTKLQHAFKNCPDK